MFARCHGPLCAIALLLACISVGHGQQYDPLTYNPQTVDWAGVVSACRAAARYELRMASFITRAAFHDALSVDVACTKLKPDPQQATYDCGGADASLMLNAAEQARSDNGMAQHSFSKRAASLVLTIAAKYKCSAADALAVCGMTMISSLGSRDLLTVAPLRVGRIDKNTANPDGQLPAQGVDSATAMKFFNDRGINTNDAIALLGAHSLVPTKGCVQTYNGSSTTSCNPLGTTTARVAAASASVSEGLTDSSSTETPQGSTGSSADGTEQPTASSAPAGRHRRHRSRREPPTDAAATEAPLNAVAPVEPASTGTTDGAVSVAQTTTGTACPNLQMFKFDNRWYMDLCTPTITVGTEVQATPIASLSTADYDKARNTATCGYTSAAFRQAALDQLAAARSGVTPLPSKTLAGVNWDNSNCASAALLQPSGLATVAAANCPHPATWFYTRNDAFIGQTCMANPPALPTTVLQDTKRAMVKFATNNGAWVKDYAFAFSRMVNVGARFSSQNFFPTFKECPSGYIADPNRPRNSPPIDCSGCSNVGAPVTTQPATPPQPPAGYSCPLGCICQTAYGLTATLAVSTAF